MIAAQDNYFRVGWIFIAWIFGFGSRQLKIHPARIHPARPLVDGYAYSNCVSKSMGPESILQGVIFWSQKLSLYPMDIENMVNHHDLKIHPARVIIFGPKNYHPWWMDYGKPYPWIMRLLEPPNTHAE